MQLVKLRVFRNEVPRVPKVREQLASVALPNPKHSEHSARKGSIAPLSIIAYEDG